MGGQWVKENKNLFAMIRLKKISSVGDFEIEVTPQQRGNQEVRAWSVAV